MGVLADVYGQAESSLDLELKQFKCNYELTLMHAENYTSKHSIHIKSQSQSQNILVINAQMALNHVKKNCKQLLRFIRTEYGFPTGI